MLIALIMINSILMLVQLNVQNCTKEINVTQVSILTLRALTPSSRSVRLILSVTTTSL